MTALDPAVVAEFAATVRPDQLICELEQLRTYDCDGLTRHRVTPALVLVPESTAEVQAIVRVCNSHGIPFVARGAGTGLSGGALPVAEGIVISLARFTRVVEIDIERGEIVVEPGVANLDVTAAVAPHGFYYAPDPSSQQVCTIGGNVAENSGGAHCLKYGFTVNHVLAAEVVLPDGELVELSVWDEGPDLLGAFIGSEGTLGIATKLRLRVLRAPEAVRTLLAGFGHTDEAGAAVSDVIAAGIVPAAIEMMDALAIEAVEAAVQANYPAGCGAVLIVEFDGPLAQVEDDLERVLEICAVRRARETRLAASVEDRARIWRGRKAAFAAMGRISPQLLRPGWRRAAHAAAIGAAQDRRALGGGGPAGRQRVPRRRRQPTSARPLRRAQRGRAGAGRRARQPDPRRLHRRGRLDHRRARRRRRQGVLDAEDVQRGATSRRWRGCGSAFDPRGLANPGKIFPTPRLCGEVPGPYRASRARAGRPR